MVTWIHPSAADTVTVGNAVVVTSWSSECGGIRSAAVKGDQVDLPRRMRNDDGEGVIRERVDSLLPRPVTAMTFTVEYQPGGALLLVGPAVLALTTDVTMGRRLWPSVRRGQGAQEVLQEALADGLAELSD